LAVLTYGSVYIFDADPHTGRPGALLARCAVPLWETQTEGISWLPDGRVLLVNEGRGGRLYAGYCP
jgi:sugar lactone lactonase YvrE